MKIFVFSFVTALVFHSAGLAQTGRPESNSAVRTVWDKDNPANKSTSSRIGGGSVLRKTYGFFWETRIDPSTPPLSDGFRTSVTEDSTPAIHRVLLDQSGRTYFGYDVLVEALSEPNRYRVTFQPLVMTQAMAWGLSMDAWSAWVPLAAPRFPPPQTIRSGEILELTLMTNMGTKQTIVDYLSIQEPSLRLSPFEIPVNRNFSYATGSPRDITSNDIEMAIQAPRISINGKLEQSTASRSDMVAGAFVWFYIPKHGRFILSLAPHADRGFRKAGETRGTTLQFMDGTDTYTVSSGSRIAPGQAAFNVYVLHQPSWKPTYLFADESAFNMGAADRFEAIDTK